MHCNIFLTKTSLLRRIPTTACSKLQFCRHSSSSSLLSHSIYKPPGSEAGPPLLITHGLLGSKFNWNSIAKATAKATNRKIVTFDARNHGDSPSHDDISYELMAKTFGNWRSTWRLISFR
ncbi:Alpha/beta hydrolase domain-containing protein 11 [Orchesella cincta]|uniref:sn-1-specific diacylglycerol lipase ABHD11 n=1 Tax=Orchesella cincta TaxID=48709 RepID=A0A1D2M9D5_ORCCI|nr:Alpha/beta hydrolase domain-containing protein 11 [Orchesella cincta]